MDPVTKEAYREYLVNRLKHVNETIEGLPGVVGLLKQHLELYCHMDYLMQQLYLLDNEPEQD